MRYEIRTYRRDGSTQSVGVYCFSNRQQAVKTARETWGTDVARVVNLDADCPHCEDRPVPNAARLTDPTAPRYAACPRCGRTHEGD
jgi:hypothetical protein